MSVIIPLIFLGVGYVIYHLFKEYEHNEEEREDGYHAAIYRYRYTHELIPFMHPKTAFEEGWNAGIEVVLEVIEGKS